MVRVMIADDHPLMLSGVEAVLQGSEFDVVAKASDGVAAMEALATARPDIVLLDVAMPIRNGIEVLRAMRSRNDRRPVVLLTAHLSDEQLLEALDLQVQGILPKEGAETLLLACLTEVHAGGQWIERSILQRALNLAMKGGNGRQEGALTPRERAIADLVARGLRNRDIAGELGITEGTVKLCLHRIFAKLEVKNRVELALLLKQVS